MNRIPVIGSDGDLAMVMEFIDDNINSRLKQEPKLKYENVIGALRMTAVLYSQVETPEKPGLMQLCIDAAALLEEFRKEIDYDNARTNRSLTMDNQMNSVVGGEKQYG